MSIIRSAPTKRIIPDISQIIAPNTSSEIGFWLPVGIPITLEMAYEDAMKQNTMQIMPPLRKATPKSSLARMIIL